MVEREQGKHLATVPSIECPRINEDNTTLHLQTRTKTKNKLIKLCTCLLAFLLLLAIVTTVLAFTVFRVKDPVITMNKYQFTKLERDNILPKPGVNVSLIADLSVSNPNLASFKYSNTTTSLYYHDVVIGEARGPPGKAMPRRSTRMNVTIDVIVDRVYYSPNLNKDLGSGLLTMSSLSRVPGQLKIFNLIKKHAIVTMNCTTTFNISALAVHDHSCKRKVKFQ